MPSTPNFAWFIGKFCYDFMNSTDKTVGEVRLDVMRDGDRQNPSSGKLYFMIFDDERQHWKKVQRSWASSTCEEKKDAASDTMEIHVDQNKPATHYRIRIREHVRPRFWYFALVGCETEFVEPLTYRIHAENKMWGWQREFSLDHMGLFNLYLVFAIAFGIATLMTAWASRSRKYQRGPPLQEHPYLKLLLISYAASTVSCMLFLAHYTLFMHDGTGSKRIRFLAVVSATVANCIIFLIAILSSVGWAISSFTMANRRGFLAMIALVGGLNAMCEFHAETTVDQSTKLFSYQSGPGVFTLILKIFIFCWFAHQIKMTYDEEFEERRRRFYKFLGISISGWSLNVPVTVLLAFALSPWWRYKIVTMVEVIARFVGQALLSQLLCGPLSPITAANTFPAGGFDASGSPFDTLDDGRGFGS